MIHPHFRHLIYYPPAVCAGSTEICFWRKIYSLYFCTMLWATALKWRWKWRHAWWHVCIRNQSICASGRVFYYLGGYVNFYYQLKNVCTSIYRQNIYALLQDAAISVVTKPLTRVVSYIHICKLRLVTCILLKVWRKKITWWETCLNICTSWSQSKLRNYICSFANCRL